MPERVLCPKCHGQRTIFCPACHGNGNLPWPLSEADEEPTDETTLTFEDGLLVE
jgi:hypothetical protein